MQSTHVSNARAREQDHQPAGHQRPWRYAPAASGYCPHGQVVCTGNAEQGVAPCLPTEHHYCGHGYDTRLATTDGQPRCPHCRGITRQQRNRDTYRRWRDPNQTAMVKPPTPDPTDREANP